MRLALSVLLACGICLLPAIAAQQPTPAADPVRAARAAFDAAAAEHGADSVPAAIAQLELATRLVRLPQPAEAAAQAAAALRVFEAHLPEQDLPAANALLVLGASHGLREDLVAAIDCYRRALAIRERHDPPNGPYVQLLRFNLAASLQPQGDYRGALALAETALSHIQQKPGEETAAVGTFLSIAAICHEGLGNLRLAHEQYVQAESILRRTRGTSFPDAIRMAGLAGSAECRMGHPEHGLPRMAAALAEMRTSPTFSPGMLCELETVEALMRGIYVADAAAAACVRTALARLDDPAVPKRQRDAHRLMLMAMLGKLLPEEVDLDAARLALVQIVGATPDQQAANLNNMAHMLLAQDQVDEARQNLERAAALLEHPSCVVAPDRWTIFWGLANLQRQNGQFPKSQALIERGLGELPRLLDAWSLPLDEPQRLELTATARAAVDLGLSIGAKLGQPAAERWQLVLTWKGLVSRGLLQPLQWLQANRDREAQQLADDLQVATATWLATAQTGAPAASIAAAQERRDALETALAKRLGSKRGVPPTAVSVAAALAPDAVLIDYFSYGHLADMQARNDLQLQERLLAFVVQQGKEPVLIDLGELASITPAVAEFLQVSSRWTKPIDGAEAIVAAAGSRLAARLWTPLQHLVPADAKVLICPESIVAVVPFACLPGRMPGTFLVEQHEFTYVANSATLDEPNEAQPANGPMSLLAVGNVDYGGRRSPASERGGDREFAPLPGSQQEIDMVVASLPRANAAKATLLHGSEATVDNVTRAVVGKRFVHIATHGWFLGSRLLPDVSQRWQRFESRGKALPANATTPGADGGIALAMANTRNTANGGGILTVDELTLLDLSQCELAVLSACETGLGTISAGDGLLGLRRSLRLAGARRSLTSIWRVEDQATVRCMQTFYRSLWAAQQSPAAALRAAQLAMLRGARADTGQALVGTWGAFVLEGR